MKKFRMMIASDVFTTARVPVISNVDAQPYVDGAKDKLLQQVTAPVRWLDSMLTLRDKGVTRAVEIGPGKVLAGLQRRIDPGLVVAPLSTPSDLASLV